VTPPRLVKGGSSVSGRFSHALMTATASMSPKDWKGRTTMRPLCERGGTYYPDQPLVEAALGRGPGLVSCPVCRERMK